MTASLKEVTFGVALTTILESAGKGKAAFHVDAGVITITTQEAATAAAMPATTQATQPAP